MFNTFPKSHVNMVLGSTGLYLNIPLKYLHEISFLRASCICYCYYLLPIPIIFIFGNSSSFSNKKKGITDN